MMVPVLRLYDIPRAEHFLKLIAMPRTVHCMACQEQVPDEAAFCCFCGFRLAPIAVPAPEPALFIAEHEPVDPALAPTVRASASNLVVPLDNGSLRDGSGREHLRFIIRVAVQHGDEREHRVGQAENMSSGGMFVATEFPGAVGEVVEISFTLPGIDLACRVVSEVQWVRQRNRAEGTSSGMGLRFSDLAPQTRSAIEAFVAHHEPLP